MSLVRFLRNDSCTATDSEPVYLCPDASSSHNRCSQSEEASRSRLHCSRCALIELIATKAKTARTELATSAQAGAEPNMKDKSGWTPLHFAAMRGNYAMCELLVKSGANKQVTSRPTKCRPRPAGCLITAALPHHDPSAVLPRAWFASLVSRYSLRMWTSGAQRAPGTSRRPRTSS